MHKTLLCGVVAAVAVSTHAAAQPSNQGCERSNDQATATGAVLGAIGGAVIGDAIGGRHDRGTDTALGAVAGGVAGATLASQHIAPCNHTPPSYRAGYAPTPTMGAAFYDDFREGLRPDNWGYVTRATTVRKQLQCYTPDNAYTGPDGLRIVLDRAPENPPPYCKGQAFTSSRLQSKQTFTFGTLSVTARLPAGAGLWPAIWMRTPEGVPLNAEIDLVEGFGSRPDLYQSTVHGWSNNTHLGSACSIVLTGIPDAAFASRHSCAAAPVNSAPFDQAFHTFSVEWRPTWISGASPSRL